MPDPTKTSLRSTARTARRRTRHGPAAGSVEARSKFQVRGIDWLHDQLAKGQPSDADRPVHVGLAIDASGLDSLALGLLLKGDTASAQVLATLANSQRLEEILEALEARNG